jgi:hypothetical protein
MVDFEHWFDNIVSSCDFVVSTAPYRVWVRGETNVTSAYDCTEFLEQTLGDLDLEGLVPQFADRLHLAGAYDAVLSFRHALLQFERLSEIRQPGAQQLLASGEWKGVEYAAKEVLALPTAQVRLKQLGSFE